MTGDVETPIGQRRADERLELRAGGRTGRPRRAHRLARDRLHVGAVVLRRDGEVVLVVLEPAQHGARVVCDEPYAPSVAAVREVGGGGVGVQVIERIAATMAVTGRRIR